MFYPESPRFLIEAIQQGCGKYAEGTEDLVPYLKNPGKEGSESKGIIFKAVVQALLILGAYI